MDDRILMVLLAIGAGYVSYTVGKDRGYNNGYNQAKLETSNGFAKCLLRVLTYT